MFITGTAISLLIRADITNIDTKNTYMGLLLLSRFSRVWLCATPHMAAHQAPPSLGFSRREQWSRLPIVFYWGGNLKWLMVHACSNLDKDSTDYNTYRPTDDSKSQLLCVNWLLHCYFYFNCENITKCFAFHFQPKRAILIPILFFWIKTFNFIEV